MFDMENEHEQRIRRKAQIFLEDKKIVHLKTFGDSWYNGRLFEIRTNSLIIHDRVDGVREIFFIDIKNISEYVEVGA